MQRGARAVRVFETGLKTAPEEGEHMPILGALWLAAGVTLVMLMARRRRHWPKR